MPRDPLSGPHGFRPRRWAAVLVLAVCAAAAAGAAEETVTLYQWTDSSGAYRYTPIFDRIPSYARETVVTIQPGAAPPPKTPVYFEPDPRAAVVAVPDQPADAEAGSAAGAVVPQASVGGWASEYDARIAELEAEIAQHEEALKKMISAPGSDADIEVSPELREMARRLPRLQAELASLRRGRASATSGP